MKHFLLQISSSANKSGKLSGQSTLSEEEDLPKAQGSSGEDSTFPIDTQQPLRQSSKKDKYSKGRNPASSIQSLNPTQQQPPPQQPQPPHPESIWRAILRLLRSWSSLATRLCWGGWGATGRRRMGGSLTDLHGPGFSVRPRRLDL